MNNDLLQAIQYASEKHKGQVRKRNGRDFFNDHCMRLLGYIACDPVYGKDLDASLIILLHDVPEDCSKSSRQEDRQIIYDEISNKFGVNVCEGVIELTDEYTKERYPHDNRAVRKADELMRLKSISLRGWTLKLYDRFVNLQDAIDDEDWNKTYAIESWRLGCELSDSDNLYIASRVMSLAAEIREKCKK